MRKIIILLALLTVSFAVNIAVSPSHYYLKMDADSFTRKFFNVTNKGDEEIGVRVYMNDWILKGDEKVFMPVGGTDYSLEDSVQYYPSYLALKPGESKQVMMNVRAEKNDTAGEYGVLFFEARPKSQPKGSGLSFGGRIGSIIHKEITDRSLVNYSVAETKANLSAKKLYYSFDILNKGNILLRPELTILVLDGDNEVIARKNVKNITAMSGQTKNVNDYLMLSSYSLKSKDITMLMTFDFGDDNIHMEEIVVR